ncbi:reverse transcriptase domain-containing protein [Tanacetum coccineum]
MDDNRTMAQLLEAPTVGYEDAIVVPEITADNFELKHGLLTLVQNKQFFGHDKEDPHAHIRYFNKITSTMKFPNVPSTSVKLMLFPFSLEGAARIWLEKEPPRSILTWDDLVSKFINKFFPPSKTTNLRNEITRFQQRFDETFYEAWDRFNDLLRACPHHGFSELHQLDTFYNALNSNDQDSLNSAAGGNVLDKMPRDCLRITESKSKVHNSHNKQFVAKVSPSSSTPGISPDVAELKDMVKALLIDKKNQNQAPTPVKAVEESCVTYGGAHSYQNYPSTDGNVYRDNIQEYVSQATTANFNQGNTSYRASIANQIRPPGQIYRPLINQPPVHQAQPYQAPTPQTQGVSKDDFQNYVKANDAVMRNMENQNQNLQNQMTNLTDMLSKFVNSNITSTSGSGTLPSNTITNPKVDLKGITTRSGVAYQGPTIPTTSSSPPKVVEREPEPVVTPVRALMPNLKTPIPYPSRRNDEKRREKANDQIEKFYKIFQDMRFEISLADALILMPKFALTLKDLIENKEKLSEMARTPLNEHCSTVILNKLPEKLRDPGKFLIPCDIPGMEECLALADHGVSINLMPLSMWKKLSLLELTPTCMTLELVDRSITKPIGIAEDVYLKVGKFKFPADFVVVDFDADSRVPLILGRSFLKTGCALIDVYEGELTLHVGKEAVTFNLDQTSRYSSNYDDMTANRIDVIEMACEEYSQEVLGFSDVIASGNPTPYYDPIVSTSSPTLTPFGDSDFLLEEVDAFLALEDDPTSPEVDDSYYDPEGDILLLESFLNDDPSSPSNQGNYLPEIRKELKICEAKIDKSSIDEPSEVELKDLPPHLEYAFLVGSESLIEEGHGFLVPMSSTALLRHTGIESYSLGECHDMINVSELRGTSGDSTCESAEIATRETDQGHYSSSGSEYHTVDDLHRTCIVHFEDIESVKVGRQCGLVYNMLVQGAAYHTDTQRGRTIRHDRMCGKLHDTAHMISVTIAERLGLEIVVLKGIDMGEGVGYRDIDNCNTVIRIGIETGKIQFVCSEMYLHITDMRDIEYVYDSHMSSTSTHNTYLQENSATVWCMRRGTDWGMSIVHEVEHGVMKRDARGGEHGDTRRVQRALEIEDFREVSVQRYTAVHFDDGGKMGAWVDAREKLWKLREGVEGGDLCVGGMWVNVYSEVGVVVVVRLGVGCVKGVIGWVKEVGLEWE